ncbi:MAG TPA: 4-(cytidine 5'-diphospho)-2-C-methyl-D-erythritol kinase [Acidimicrobiales bacterium]|nr:4-(cytidine 5'-diphospho)-2-C-methyl-D-erythritol kinase [Acidimicrobiales bacterium]
MLLTAPAKLTLSLRVTGRRPDGYHLLDAEMVTIDVADLLEFTEVDGEVDGDSCRLGVGDGHSHGVEVVDEVVGGTGIGDLGPGPDNLVVRALGAVGRRAAVRLVKRIPLGAGLGGGSADAAAVLRWAGCTELDVAASLGADVPFCVAGGRARVRGIGEHLSQLPYQDRRFLVLLPPLSVDTATVYRAWDDMAEGGAQGSGISSAHHGGNDLEAAALVVEPRLAAWRDAFAAMTGSTPSLAGSGSAWFVEVYAGDDAAPWATGEDVAPADGGTLVLHGRSAPVLWTRTVPATALSAERSTGPDAALPPEGAGV